MPFAHSWNKQDGLKCHFSFSCKVALSKWVLRLLEEEEVEEDEEEGK